MAFNLPSHIVTGLLNSGDAGKVVWNATLSAEIAENRHREELRQQLRQQNAGNKAKDKEIEALKKELANVQDVLVRLLKQAQESANVNVENNNDGETAKPKRRKKPAKK